MQPRFAVRWSGWFLLLPIGAGTLFVVNPWVQHRSDDRGFGVFYGHVEGRVFGNSQSPCFHFEGRTPPAWRWAAPSNYVYETLDIEWCSRDGGENRASLLLPSMTLVIGEDRVPWTEDWLRDLMIAPEQRADGYLGADVHYLYELLHSADEGGLPKPQHHSRTFGKALQGNFVHSSLGS